MAGALQIVNGSLRPCAAQRTSFTPVSVPNWTRRPSSVSCIVERRATQQAVLSRGRRITAAPISAVAATEERTQQYVLSAAVDLLSMHRSGLMGILRVQETSDNDISDWSDWAGCHGTGTCELCRLHVAPVSTSTGSGALCDCRTLP